MGRHFLSARASRRYGGFTKLAAAASQYESFLEEWTLARPSRGLPDYIPDNVATGAMATPLNRELLVCDGFCMPTRWNTTIHTLPFLILGWLSFYFT